MRSLIHTLFFGIWAMRPEAVQAYMPQVERVLRGETVMTEEKPTQTELMERVNLHFVTEDGRRLEVRGKDSQPIVPEPNMVAVMDISGPIMKDDWCDDPGTTTMARWLQEFDDTPELRGTVLNIDSPGGNGHAMMTLTGAMARLKKPTVSLIEGGMAASAAYGTAASTKHIMAANATDEFGSIGTYVRLANWDKAFRNHKNMPLEVHTVFASRSTAKNRDFLNALNADPTNLEDKHYEALRKNYLDPFNNEFIALVQRNRPQVKDENDVLAGQMFLAADALKYGLIDTTGATMADAIGMVRELAKATN